MKTLKEFWGDPIQIENQEVELYSKSSIPMNPSDLSDFFIKNKDRYFCIGQEFQSELLKCGFLPIFFLTKKSLGSPYEIEERFDIPLHEKTKDGIFEILVWISETPDFFIFKTDKKVIRKIAFAVKG